MDAVGTGRAAALGAAVVTGWLGAMAAAGAAAAAPRVDAVRLDGAVAGSPVELRIRARDPEAPVTGIVAGFGRGEGGVGLSSCMPGAPPNTPATLAAPHVFATPGTRSVAARITSAGCTGGQPSLVQRLTVPVARRGATPRPPTPAPPQLVPLGQPVPGLPGLGRLPVGGADLPPPVGVAASCPGSSRRFRATRRGARAARRALLCLLNVERGRRGLGGVRSNGRLGRAALGHSRAMVGRRFFAHVGPGSLTLSDRLRRARYIPRRGGRWLVGENIGFGRGRMTRPWAMHRAWMRSAPHRAAMLDRRFREVGFGVARGRPYGRGGATFTADFGRRGR